MEDEKILQLLRTAPETGLWELTRKYGALAKAVAGRILPAHPEDVEECVADTFIRIWKNCTAIEAKNGSVKGYVICAARSIAIDRYRKLRREQSFVPADEQMADREDFIETVESTQGLADIRAMVEDMGQPDREIFLRRYFLCQSIKDIAKLLDMGEKAVESRLFRGRQKLKTQLERKEVPV